MEAGDLQVLLSGVTTTLAGITTTTVVAITEEACGAVAYGVADCGAVAIIPAELPMYLITGQDHLWVEKTVLG
ncbi:hypothetical protein [Pedobacter sp. V48]|uniref:hypothetical protein n=1 Tax=Pedobacter sp. V48 TaxID=509635 RepID=UPI00126972D7|nr:hypothetical protein [Pedobacter sp. V48]